MQISGGKGRPPQTIFGTRKVESLGYRMVKKIAEKFNHLSRVHQRHRQTTDGIAIAISERNVVTFAKKRQQRVLFSDRGRWRCPPLFVKQKGLQLALFGPTSTKLHQFNVAFDKLTVLCTIKFSSAVTLAEHTMIYEWSFRLGGDMAIERKARAVSCTQHIPELKWSSTYSV